MKKLKRIKINSIKLNNKKQKIILLDRMIFLETGDVVNPSSVPLSFS